MHYAYRYFRYCKPPITFLQILDFEFLLVFLPDQVQQLYQVHGRGADTPKRKGVALRDAARLFSLLSNMAARILLISTANDLVLGISQQSLTEEPPLRYP